MDAGASKKIREFGWFKKAKDSWPGRGVREYRSRLQSLRGVLSVFCQRRSLSQLCHELYQSAPADCSMLGFHFLGRPALLLREPGLVQAALLEHPERSRAFGLPSSKTDPLLSRSPPLADAAQGFCRLFTERRLRSAFELARRVFAGAEVRIRARMSVARGGGARLRLGHFTAELGVQLALDLGLGELGSRGERDAAARLVRRLARVFRPGWASGLRQAACLLTPGLAARLGLRLVPRRLDRALRALVRRLLQRRRRADNVLDWMAEATADEDWLVERLCGFLVEIHVYLGAFGTLLLNRLAWQPEVQARAREEVFEASCAFGGEGLCYGAVESLGYLDRVISEAMRLAPPLDCVARECTEAWELRGRDGQRCEVRPGELIFVSRRGLHLDERHWPQPERFDPDRFVREQPAFLPLEETSATRFHRMALKTLLAMLLSSCQLEGYGEAPQDVKLSPSSYLSVPGELYVVLKEID